MGTLLIKFCDCFHSFSFPGALCSHRVALSHRVCREPVIKRSTFPDLLSTKGFRSNHSTSCGLAKIITGQRNISESEMVDENCVYKNSKVHDN